MKETQNKTRTTTDSISGVGVNLDIQSGIGVQLLVLSQCPFQSHDDGLDLGSLVGGRRIAGEALGLMTVVIAAEHQAAGSGADGIRITVAAAAAIHVKLHSINHGDGEIGL